MKNIVIIPENKIKVLTSCDCFPANGYFTFNKKDAKVKQVPINWEELKELCKELKEYIIWNKNYCEIKNFKISKNGNIYYRQIQIYSDETITKNYVTVVNNRTIPQLWDFIKSLIG